MKEPEATHSPSSPSTDLFFTIENLGCSKNQVDAEQMIAALSGNGWVYTEDPEQAALIIVNSCAFIESAREESVEAFFELRRRFPDRKIILAGCMAQRYGETLIPLLPELDLVFGNRAPSRITEAADLAVRRDRDGEGPESEPLLLMPGYPEESPVSPPGQAGSGSLPGAVSEAAAEPVPNPHEPERRRFLSYPGSAYLKIAEGCRNRCTYCAIPLIRGDLRSRPLEEVLSEARGLIGAGIREINLIAQDLGSWGLDRGQADLPGLLDGISRIEGDFWVRMLYIHPDRFPEGLLDRCLADPRILPYFDIPFQHASRRVLSGMGRRGDRETYLDLIRRIRGAIPEAVVRSTFLVGFPGEGEREFEELLAFQQEARLDWMGCFVYSREEDTAAYRMRGADADRRARRKAEGRKALLEERQVPITEQRLSGHLGRTLRLLAEEQVEGTDLTLCRGYLHAPDVDGMVVLQNRVEPGTFTEGKIIRRNGFDLEAMP